MHTRTWPFLSTLVMVSTLLSSTDAAAATRTWTGLISNQWNVAGNWGGVLPVAGDDLVFPAGAMNTTNNNNFAAGTAFNSITFNAAYTVSGNAITINAGGLDVIVPGPGVTQVTFGLVVTLGANQTWTLPATVDSLAQVSNVILAGRTLTIDNAGPMIFTNVTVISGTGGIIKSGPGQLVINGANTFAGPVTINGGNLTVSHASALGIADGTTPNGTTIGTAPAGAGSGPTLVFNGVAIGNEAVTVSGPDVNGFGVIGNTGVSSLAGPLVLTDHLRMVVSGTLTFAGAISGAGQFGLGGNGTVVLTHAGNTFTGGVDMHRTSVAQTTLSVAADQAIPSQEILVVDGTTLAINNHVQTLTGLTNLGRLDLPTAGSRLNLNGTTLVNYGGPITGTGTLSYVGSGRQTISGAGATFAGSIEAHSGILSVTNVLPGNVSVLTGGQFVLQLSARVGTLNAGGGIVKLGEGTGATVNLQSGPLQLAGASTLQAVGSAQVLSQLHVTGTVTLGGAALSLVLAPDFAVPVGTTFTLIENDGSEPVTGTFAGLANNATFVSSGATFRINYAAGVNNNDVVLTQIAAPARDYLLSEGASGGFFTTDISLANPNALEAPVHLSFLKDNGETVTLDVALPAMSHKLIRVNAIAGMAEAAFSTIVRSQIGLPLAVERTMSWDQRGYGAHTEHATDGAATTWYFAEGSQGFFHTYLLLTNPQATSTTATVEYLRENDGPVTRNYVIGPTSRLTVDTALDPELSNQSFGMTVTLTQPGAAERAMYFGDAPLFSGGHESAGVTTPAKDWYLAEGATGPFFETFILVTNPNTVAADVTFTYLTPTGAPISKTIQMGTHARLTVNIEGEDPSLANVPVSTQISSTHPVLVERSQYWPDPAPSWYEAHNSFGVTTLGTTWALAEGRVGNVDGVVNAQTYILLANPGTQPLDVTVTFLRDNPAANITKVFSVPATSRFNIRVGPGTEVPELNNEHFGALIVSSLPNLVVERAMYWDALGQTWAAGTNATATKLQ